MAICPQCSQENPDGFTFCGACGAPLEAVKAREARKTVTVLFCDVTGSTALGERLDPESMRRVMGRYFDGAREVLERHGGTVEKFIGDAVMAVFGVPVLHEDDALRAVRAGAELRDAIGRLNEDLQRDFGVGIAVRTGINTGEVVAGEASDGEKLVTGDAVNVAARLEQSAQPGEILIGHETYRLVRDWVEVEELEPLALKGKAEVVPALRLSAVQSEASAHARQLDSPMVGRDREQSLLHQAFERAVGDGSCQLFTVLGAAGVGKSRLVREFTRTVEDEATVLSGRCLSYGEGITFWPLVEVVRSLTGEDVVSAIAALLGSDEEARLVAERIAGAIGVTLTSTGGQETAWAVRKLFEAHARTQPLIVVFDDVHWAEPTFLDLVEQVTDWSRDAPILLVCMARPELLDARPAWGGGKLNATAILLEPLADEECGALIDNLLGRSELAENVRAKIAEAAEGNPLFVEEMLEMLIDDGLLRREDGRWAAAGDLSSVSVPPSIQALVSARLDRLEPDERDVIRLAAVEGKIFHRGAVAELTGEDERPRVPEQLMALIRKELIRPEPAQIAGEDAFRFRHQLIRDAAYESMPKEVRADLHERFADWLERVASDRIIEYEEILGYHLEQAYRYRTELAPIDETGTVLAARAAERLGPAGRRALRRGDWPGGANLMMRAGGLLPETSPERARLLAEAGAALIEAGELDEADRILGEAIESARAASDRSSELRALLEQGFLRTLTDPASSDGFQRTVELALPELESLGDESVLATGWAMLAHVHLLEMRTAAMQEALERSVEYARRSGDRQQEVDAIRWLLRLRWFGPEPVEDGIRFCEETLELARDDPSLEAVALQVLGLLEGMRGDFDRSRELMKRARDAQFDLGMVVAAAAGSSMMMGSLELMAGDPQAAEEAFRWGVDMLEKIGEKGYLSTQAGFLAEAVYELGRYDEAERLTEISREASGPDDLESQRLWRQTKGKVLARKGEVPAGEALAREALAIADRTDALLSRAEARLTLAEILRLSDRAGEAAELVREAADLYERKGVVPWVATTRKLLSELEAESSSG